MDTSVFAYPKLHFFTSGNPYTGSHRGMNYKLVPVIDKEADTKVLKVAVWYGPNCSTLSEMEAETELPLTEDGLAQSREYLAEQYAIFCEKHN